MPWVKENGVDVWREKSWYGEEVPLRSREIREVKEKGEAMVEQANRGLVIGQEMIMRTKEYDRVRRQTHEEDSEQRQEQVREEHEREGRRYKKDLCKYHQRREWSCWDGDRCTCAHGEGELWAHAEDSERRQPGGYRGGCVAQVRGGART